ncbi:ferritin light chain-like [Fukomys damarensis]|uniref:Ferritin n=1 Tax=Fukomys damarensis TaxID=885580 RepID=A0A091DCR2_FUKDA|nr:ferritin light chain-like [Fukomys damarensis]KFO28248.1 Ferritin light chain [Fukomys damarensis]
MNTHSMQNFSTQVESALYLLINMHLHVSQTYISLGFYFVGNRGAQEDVDHFFHELAEKKYDSAHRLLLRSQSGMRSLCQAGQRVPQAEWCNSQQAMETALVLEKNLNQTLLELHALGWANTDCHLCDFLVNHFLEEEVKIIQKMEYHLTNFRCLTSPEAVLSESLSKLTLKSK